MKVDRVEYYQAKLASIQDPSNPRLFKASQAAGVWREATSNHKSLPDREAEEIAFWTAFTNVFSKELARIWVASLFQSGLFFRDEDNHRPILAVDKVLQVIKSAGLENLIKELENDL